MPATISQTGTWTGFTFSATPAGKTKENEPTLASLNLSETLANDDFDELRQFITLVANAYSIGWRHALVLVQTALAAMSNRSKPHTQDVYTP